MTMDIIEAIQERRSIRAFQDTPISDGTIGRLLASARLAPSAGNLEPWKFIIVKREEIKNNLAMACYNQDFIVTAPVCIVVCAEPQRSAARYGERGAELYCIQDTAAAIQNMLLTATAYGLGSCWVGAMNEEKVKEILGLDNSLRPVAIIPIGYPAEDVEIRPERSMDEIVTVLQ